MCVACNFQEPTGPQGSRSYCIDKFYRLPCDELKRRYYPLIPVDDLWGFHGTNNPITIEFMNRGKDPTAIQTPDPFNEFEKQLPSEDKSVDRAVPGEDSIGSGNLDTWYEEYFPGV